MTLLIQWSGDGLSGALTTSSADANDTAPSFITGTTPTIEPVADRSPAIRFAQATTDVNYAVWTASASDLAAYAVRLWDFIFTAAPATPMAILEFVNAADTLLSWGVLLNSAGRLQIMDKAGATQATGTVSLTPGKAYRIEATVNGSLYTVTAYLSESTTAVDSVKATLAAPVSGGRMRLGNALGGLPVAPPYYVGALEIYDVPALPALDLTDVSRCWASISDVLEHTKTVATAEDVVMAQGVVEGAANRVWRETDSTESDYYWLKRAVAWQSKYVVDNPDLFAMAGDLTSLSQDGFSASWGGNAAGAGSMAGRLVSPVAMMMLNNIRQGANTSLRVNSGFQGARRRGRGGVRWKRA